MKLTSHYSHNRLLKLFIELGPYIREDKCENKNFFFDCLVVCVNVKLALEIREFWGWWMQLKAQNDHFTYEYYSGLFDRHGNWKIAFIQDKQNSKKIQNTLNNFHRKLHNALLELQLDLKPALDSKNTLINVETESLL